MDVSAKLIQHDGDAIASRVPALKALQGHYGDFGEWLVSVAGVDFVGDAKDEATLYAKATFDKIMTAFGKIYVGLGQAIGVQGDRLNLVRRIGDETEAGTSQHAGNWPGGGPRG